MGAADDQGQGGLTNPFTGGRDLAARAAWHRLGGDGEGRRNTPPLAAQAETSRPGAPIEAAWSRAAFADLLHQANLDRRHVVQAMRGTGPKDALRRVEIMRRDAAISRSLTDAQMWWLAKELPAQEALRAQARRDHQHAVLATQWQQRRARAAEQRRHWRRQAGRALVRWAAWQARRAALGARDRMARAADRGVRFAATTAEDFGRALLGQHGRPGMGRTMRRQAVRTATRPRRRKATARSPITRAATRIKDTLI